jgi:2-dehydropantoate 2-reductase
MNIVIYGAGGVGGYFGARLEQSGNRITFIARGEHLKAIQKNGLLVKSFKGDYRVFPATATADISEVTNIDLVLVCVKTWQLKEAALNIKPALGKKTMVIPLLNGVENDRVLCSVIQRNHVLGGLSRIVSKIEDYGVISHLSYEPTIVFGELDLEISQRGLELEKLILSAGIKTKFSRNIHLDIWSKFIFITTISGMGALTRSSVGVMMASEYIKKLMYRSAEEIVAIAKAKGIQLGDTILEKQFQIIEDQPFGTTASLQRDIMAGRPSELEAQSGSVVKLGEMLGVPTPINSFIYYSLLPQENASRKLS